MNAQPVSPLEQLLTQFWDDALGRNDSEPLTHFFAAGGQETEAGRLLSMIEDAFHVEVPLAALQEAPTVRAFAEAMKHQVILRAFGDIGRTFARAPFRTASQRAAICGASW